MRRREWIKALGTGLVAGWAGCAGRGGPFAVGVHPWPGYESLYLAEHFGWLPQQVQLRKGRRAGDSLAGLADGSLDAGALTLDEMLRARGQGVPLMAVLVFNDSVGADAVLARPHISEWSDLIGRRIAVEHSGTGELVLSRLLQVSGLRRDQLVVLDVAPHEQVQAWRSGRIDAAVTYEPVASHLAALGARRLLDSSSFPDLILDVLAVRRDRVTGRDDTLRALLVAHFRALEHVRLSPDDAFRRIAAWRGISADAVRQSFSGLELPGLERNAAYLAGPAPGLRRTAEAVQRVLVAEGLLARSDALHELTDDRWLPGELRGQV